MINMEEFRGGSGQARVTDNPAPGAPRNLRRLAAEGRWRTVMGQVSLLEQHMFCTVPRSWNAAVARCPVCSGLCVSGEPGA
jgi:hypothetical protein